MLGWQLLGDPAGAQGRNQSLSMGSRAGGRQRAPRMQREVTCWVPPAFLGTFSTTAQLQARTPWGSGDWCPY